MQISDRREVHQLTHSARYTQTLGLGHRRRHCLIAERLYTNSTEAGRTWKAHTVQTRGEACLFCHRHANLQGGRNNRLQCRLTYPWSSIVLCVLSYLLTSLWWLSVHYKGSNPLHLTNPQYLYTLDCVRHWDEDVKGSEKTRQAQCRSRNSPHLALFVSYRRHISVSLPRRRCDGDKKPWWLCLSEKSQMRLTHDVLKRDNGKLRMLYQGFSEHSNFLSSQLDQKGLSVPILDGDPHQSNNIGSYRLVLRQYSVGTWNTETSRIKNHFSHRIWRHSNIPFVPPPHRFWDTKWKHSSNWMCSSLSYSRLMTFLRKILFRAKYGSFYNYITGRKRDEVHIEE